MKIEEKELRYPPEAPLHAWRLFRVRASREGTVLSAPMYHDPDWPSWPARAGEAFCDEGHRAPAAGCRCGIYGAVRGTLDSLPGYLRDTAYEADPWAYAEIACSGRVFVDMRGVRAERAELVRLALAEEQWPDAERLARACLELSERYGVHVGGLETVPDWVTRNVREGGPPPTEAELKLDLGRLQL